MRIVVRRPRRVLQPRAVVQLQLGTTRSAPGCFRDKCVLHSQRRWTPRSRNVIAIHCLPCRALQSHKLPSPKLCGAQTPAAVLCTVPYVLIMHRHFAIDLASGGLPCAPRPCVGHRQMTCSVTQRSPFVLRHLYLLIMQTAAFGGWNTPQPQVNLPPTLKVTATLRHLSHPISHIDGKARANRLGSRSRLRGGLGVSRPEVKNATDFQKKFFNYSAGDGVLQPHNPRVVSELPDVGSNVLQCLVQQLFHRLPVRLTASNF